VIAVPDTCLDLGEHPAQMFTAPRQESVNYAAGATCEFVHPRRV
jgi:hypothetical protein